MLILWPAGLLSMWCVFSCILGQDSHIDWYFITWIELKPLAKYQLAKSQAYRSNGFFFIDTEALVVPDRAFSMSCFWNSMFSELATFSSHGIHGFPVEHGPGLVFRKRVKRRDLWEGKVVGFCTFDCQSLGILDHLFKWWLGCIITSETKGI